MRRTVFFLLLASTWINYSCNKNCESGSYTVDTDTITYRVVPFNIKDVKLLDGPYKHATDLNIKILLDYDPDRLLAKFRIEAGLKPKAEHYGGWEDESLAGHSLGHYLSACALMYNTTSDDVFLERVNYIVNELVECQKAEGSGYLGAAPRVQKVFEDEIEKGDIRSKGFDLNGIWAPIYTQHKILMGLIDAYKLCDNKQALDVAMRFANWMEGYMSQLNHEQIQEMLNCEHGGINEALAELFVLTGEKKYLDLSKKYYHEAILDPLSKKVDILPGKHANTQIPKLIGLARLYEITGDTSFENTAKFFWDRVVYHHSYVTGGHCDHEYFGPPDTLRDRLSTSTTETCNVYNMLKLSRHLFEWSASAQVADFYERALLNHILASQHPSSGHVIYNLSLEMGGFKEYQDPEWFTCCVGTGMETHSKYPANIYYYNDKELFVSQFIASRVNWKDKGVEIEQNTNYPEEQSTSLKIICDKPVQFNLNIRYPYWAESGIEIKINNKKVRVNQKPSSFICINRIWKSGDQVNVSFPFSLRTEGMPDDSNRIAVFYGPLVLAGDLGDTNDVLAYSPMYVPVLITENKKITDWLKPVEGKTNTFQTVDVGNPRDMILKPFYKTNDRRYSIYWDIFTQEKWKNFQQEYKADIERKKKIEQITVDFFQPGEMQPERDHNFKENNSWVGIHKGRKYRETNGWLKFQMKTDKKSNIALMVDYWGGFPGSKTFDIIVEGTLIKTENISNRNMNKFISETYEVSTRLTKGKSKITVELRSHDGHRAGPIFGVRTIQNID